MSVAATKAADLRAWASAARPGARLTYFVGFLARSPGMRPLAEEAQKLSRGGRVLLMQRRLGPDTFAYIAQLATG